VFKWLDFVSLRGGSSRPELVKKGNDQAARMFGSGGVWDPHLESRPYVWLGQKMGPGPRNVL